MMDRIDLTGDHRDRWDAALHRSPYAWFWHTRSWMDYARAYSADGLVADASFLLHEGADLLSACPVHVEQGTPWDKDARKLALSGGPLPFPAVAGEASETHERSILDRYVQELERIAAAHDATYVSVRVPSVAPCHLADPPLEYHPLQLQGFIPTPQLTRIVDLTRDEDALRKDMRKGHRHDIRDASEVCTFHAWDVKSITPEKFRQYQDLHAKDAGRVTRPQETFDRMYDWIQGGHAAVMEAEYDGSPQAFAIVMTFGTGGFYGSACKDPDRWEVPGQHLIQWETMRWLKDRGYRRYDLGLQVHGPRFMDNPDEKQVSIARFKRGFGGRTVPLYTAEHHYTEEHLRKAMEARTEAFIEDERTDLR